MLRSVALKQGLFASGAVHLFAFEVDVRCCVLPFSRYNCRSRRTHLSYVLALWMLAQEHSS